MTRPEIVTLIRSFVGCSLDSPPDRLGELARLVDFPGGAPPEVEVQIKTNCAMFVLGIWRQLGCKHHLLHHQYVNGMALTWALEIARDCHALHLPHDGHMPQPGDVCHYATAPKPGVDPVYDDHLEFVLTAPGDDRLVLHAGGGRARNAIAEGGPDDYTVNHWRPLRHWIDTALVIGAAQ